MTYRDPDSIHPAMAHYPDPVVAAFDALDTRMQPLGKTPRAIQREAVERAMEAQRPPSKKERRDHRRKRRPWQHFEAAHEAQLRRSIAPLAEREAQRRRSQAGQERLAQRRLTVYERDDYICQGCGLHHDELAAMGVRLTLDHIIPKSRGGTNGLDNLQTMCGPCNEEKGDRMPESFRSSVRR